MEVTILSEPENFLNTQLIDSCSIESFAEKKPFASSSSHTVYGFGFMGI